MFPNIFRRALLGSVALATAAQFARPRQPSRPNILWLVSEDNNPYIGVYGDKLAHTPNIDNLAARGILYRHVFCTAPVCAPSRFAIITGMLPESVGPAHNMRAKATVPSFLRGFPEYLRNAGYYCSNNSKTDYNCNIDPDTIWNRSSPSAHWRDRPSGVPFFAVFNFESTHESAVFAPTTGRVKPGDVRVPAYLPDTLAVRQDISSYYSCIERMDHQIGKALAELEHAGLTEDTIIFHYSDNGGVLPRSKRYCYDEGMRCEMVIYIPPRWAQMATAQPGSVIEHPVTLVDLAPTVLSLAGVDIPPYMHGRPFLGLRAMAPRTLAFGMRNRMDERYDMVRTVCDGRFRYIRNYTPNRIWGQHQSYAWQMRSYQEWEGAHLSGRLSGAQDRFWNEKPFEEFYDLANDADQITNLIGHAGYLERIEAMREALDQHILNINDNGFIPEGSRIEGYTASRADGAYPLREVMTLAAKAAQRNPKELNDFTNHLSSKNEIMRYWAAQGLLMLGDRAASATDILRHVLTEDQSAHVRIVAAEALATLGEAPVAVTVLAYILDTDPSPRVRLQALNALTYINEHARLALPAITRAESSEDEYLIVAARYLRSVLENRYTPELPIVGPRAIPMNKKHDQAKSLL